VPFLLRPGVGEGGGEVMPGDDRGGLILFKGGRGG